jgi:proline iminopeptidase
MHKLQQYFRLLFWVSGCLLAFSATFAQDTSGTFFSRNTDLYYEVYGKGQPLYLLSGGPGLSPNYLRPIIDILKSDFQCVVLHQRGTGKSKSASLDDGISIQLLTADIMHLRRHLKHQEIIVMAHSWSTILALNFAAIYPDFVRQLVLISPSPLRSSQLDSFSDNVFAGLSAAEQKTVLRLRDSLAILITDSKNDFTQPKVQEVLFKMLQQERSGYLFDKSKLSQVLDPKPDNLNVSLMLVLNDDLRNHQYDIEGALRGTDIPVLMIQGMQDPTSKESTKELMRIFLHKEEHWMPQCGHYPWIDQPTDFFTILKTKLLRF